MNDELVHLVVDQDFSEELAKLEANRPDDAEGEVGRWQKGVSRAPALFQSHS